MFRDVAYEYKRKERIGVKDCVSMIQIDTRGKSAQKRERIGLIESDWRRQKKNEMLALIRFELPVFHENATLTVQSLSKFKFRFTVSVKLCIIILWKLPSGHRLLVTIFGTRPNV